MRYVSTTTITTTPSLGDLTTDPKMALVLARDTFQSPRPPSPLVANIHSYFVMANAERSIDITQSAALTFAKYLCDPEKNSINSRKLRGPAACK